MKKRSRFAKKEEETTLSADTYYTYKNDKEVDYLNDDIETLIAPSSDQSVAKRKKVASPEPNRKISTTELMQEQLAKGMQTALPSTNKGFQLMTKKFGFQVGAGLGKIEDGIKDPIAILSTIPDSNAQKSGSGKSTKSGIGMATLHKQRIQSILDLQSSLLQSFQDALRQKFQLSKLRKDIKQAANVLCELDLAATGYFSHPLSWQVHCETQQKLYKSTAGDNYDDIDIDRKKYESYGNHCDENDEDPVLEAMEAKLKNAYDNHLMQLTSQSTVAIAEERDSTQSELDIETWTFVFSDILHHLRTRYHYCVYCGIKYEHQEDLLSNCPGMLDSDH